MQAGRLHDPFPARSAPSGWGPPGREETGATRTGSGLASLRYGDATPAQNGGSRLSLNLGTRRTHGARALPVRRYPKGR